MAAICAGSWYCSANALTQELNREPTIEELSKELDMEPEKIEYVIKIKQDISSLDASVGRDGEDDESALQDFIVDEDTVSPEDSATSQLLKEQVQDMLSSLSDREQKIVRMRFGLDNGKNHTLEEAHCRDYSVFRYVPPIAPRNSVDRKSVV